MMRVSQKCRGVGKPPDQDKAAFVRATFARIAHRYDLKNRLMALGRDQTWRQVAAELANADSLEDISDVMAETLFGVEFEQIAQEALKNPPATGWLPGETDVQVSPALATSGSSPLTTPSGVRATRSSRTPAGTRSG